MVVMLNLRFTSAVFLISLTLMAAPKKAKNVIVFLADAGGVATVNAASLHGYGEPLKLYVQGWPNVGLSDTSTASGWVTDSAAGMTAIVTGVKTQNGVISMGADTVRGKQDGKTLKTLLEYAEERGLSTGVVSDMSIGDATPAACYGHANDRAKQSELFLQIFSPRYGDGVDVVIGAGRKNVMGANPQAVEAAAKKAQRTIYSALADAPESDARPVVVQDGNVDVAAATRRAVSLLSKNRKGYFLMVEWDAHTDNPRKGLDRLVGLDKLMREIAAQVDLKETLLLFTADHSFDLRTVGGKRGDPLLQGYEEWQKTHTAKEEVRIPALRVGHGHTGEEVVVAAQGPGAERVKGFMPNTRLFEIILQAWGWKQDGQ
jgi:alkaline phosphatase